MRSSSGLGLISVAALVAGVAGYLATWIVARLLGPADYGVFAVFWAVMYFGVGALSGIQQEVARATSPVDPDERPGAVSRARGFGLVAAAVVAVAVGASAPFWAPQIFPSSPWGFSLALVVALSSYVLVACVSGSLYGVSRWREIAALVAVDGLVRLALVGVAAALGADPPSLAWAAALPFPAALLLWPILRGALVGRTRTDAGYGTLAWNSARTVFAAASIGLLVSGLPAVLGIGIPELSVERLGVVALAVTVVRAPIVIGALAIQSFLVVQFRGGTRAAALLLRGHLLIVVAVGVLAIVGGLVGPALFQALFGSAYAVEPGLIAALVGSSGLLAGMILVGTSLVAAGRHGAYSAGFLTAAAATVGALVLPLDPESRLLVAILGAPAIGYLVLLGLRVVLDLRAAEGQPDQAGRGQS